MFQPDKELSAAEVINPWHDLAEAIRLGCKEHPRQVFGRLTNNNDGTCVIGAALAGGYGYMWPARSAKEPMSCPCCSLRGHIGRVLMHLNDDHYLKRETIADWLDGKAICSANI